MPRQLNRENPQLFTQEQNGAVRFGSVFGRKQ
jgi:hypothetical protein